jgi:hypothetical protein
MARSLEELLAQLTAEPQPIEFDWDAPEAGQYPPQVQPGTVEFLFTLHPGEVDNGDNGPFVDGIGMQKIENHPHLAILFDAEVFKRDGSTANINFNRVNAYKHPKVNQSSLQELLRSLGLKPNNSPLDVIRAVQGASARVRAKGEVAWRFYCKTHELTISTSPRSRKVKSTGDKVKDTAWPRATDGSFEKAVACPKCEGGIKQFGRVEFVTYYSAAAASNGQ